MKWLKEFKKKEKNSPRCSRKCWSDNFIYLWFGPCVGAAAGVSGDARDRFSSPLVLSHKARFCQHGTRWGCVKTLTSSRHLQTGREWAGSCLWASCVLGNRLLRRKNADWVTEWDFSDMQRVMTNHQSIHNAFTFSHFVKFWLQTTVYFSGILWATSNNVLL